MRKNILVKIFLIIFSISSFLCSISCQKKEPYKLNFFIDNTIYATINTNGNELVTIPADPKKSDFEFDGWFLDNSTWEIPFNEDSLLNISLSNNLNVYAKWTPKKVSISEITLNKNELILSVGDSETLEAFISPENATEKNISWKSSDVSVVTIENGTILAVGLGFATVTATAIVGNKQASCSIEVIEDTIKFSSLTIMDNGETVYGCVSNDTKTFSFLKEISEQGKATYQVYKEITCETLITSKTISLEIGDNTVYILQTVGNNLKLYKVTVRRRPIYTITFNTDNGTPIPPQQVEEDNFAIPVTATKIGYSFISWYTSADFKNVFYFSSPIKSDITIYAKYDKLEYTVTLKDGSNKKITTYNGIIYGLETLAAKNGKEFDGWYVSDFNDEKKLTYKYNGETIYEDINLYPVWKSEISSVSVTESKISWEADGSGFEVKITDPNNVSEIKHSTLNYLYYQFKVKGEYKIEIYKTGSNQCFIAYYLNKL